jgi:hypothetical protein
MSRRIVVTGTDTEIGKTVFSAGLVDFLGANYWKPIQAGLGGETDSQLVARLGGLSDDRIVPERYRLQTPASPYHAAAIDGVRIDAESLDVPDTGERALVIGGAGTRVTLGGERGRLAVVNSTLPPRHAGLCMDPSADARDRLDHRRDTLRSDLGALVASSGVNRRSNLTPHRRPILTPLGDGFWR